MIVARNKKLNSISETPYRFSLGKITLRSNRFKQSNKTHPSLVIANMKHLVICFLMLSSPSFSQKMARGNWLTISRWSCSYTKLKKNGKVVQFTADCKDRGTKRTGNWIQTGNTVYIITEIRSATFLLRDDKLCWVDNNGEVNDSKYGIARSNVRSISAAKRKIRRAHKRD